MISFKNFLDSDNHKVANEVAILLKKIISNVNFVHIDKRDSDDIYYISFNVGDAANDERYNNLEVRIYEHSGLDEGIYDEDGKKIIVVNTGTKLPPYPKEIVEFIRHTSTNSSFKEMLKFYINNFLNKEKKTKNQEVEHVNSTFESLYDEIRNKLYKLREELEKSIEWIDSNHDDIDDSVEPEEITNKAKLEAIKGTYGSNDKEFIKKITEEFKDKINLLSKENKEKLESRLRQYYNSIKK